MSDKICGGWSHKWLRMWTKEWVDRDTGLRSPAVRIYRSWYYGKRKSRYSPGNGGQKRSMFYHFIVWDQDGVIVEQGCIQGSDGLSKTKKICSKTIGKLKTLKKRRDR